MSFAAPPATKVNFTEWHVECNLSSQELHIYEFLQHCSNSIANALELLQSRTKPSIQCKTVNQFTRCVYYASSRERCKWCFIIYHVQYPTSMGLLPDMQNCWLRMRRECRGRFPRHWLQRKLLVSDPSMHHGTCVTHVPWCMSGSLARNGGENVLGIPGPCATRNFAYLSMGLWVGLAGVGDWISDYIHANLIDVSPIRALTLPVVYLSHS